MNTLLKKTGDRDTSLLARGCWDDITSSSLDLISGVMSRLKERIENHSLGVILVIKCSPQIPQPFMLSTTGNFMDFSLHQAQYASVGREDNPKDLKFRMLATRLI